MCRLRKWADGNLMKFSKVKCSVLHLGKNNRMHQYVLGDCWLESSCAEKDFEVLVDHKLTKQYALMAKETNSTWGYTGRSVASS